MKSTKRSSTFSYFELLDACKKSGCPICRLGQRAAQRQMTGLIYDGVNDVPSRAVLRDSYGYCHEHGWKLPDSGESAPLGIAIIHRDMLNTLRARLEQDQYQKERRASIRSRVTGALKSAKVGADPTQARYIPVQAECPACERRSEAEELAFISLLEALDKNDEAMSSALEASDGLCIVHLRRALNTSNSEQAFGTLIAVTNRQLAETIQQLDEFIRKNDHRFRDESITRAEGSSWLRALQRASGKKAD